MAGVAGGTEDCFHRLHDDGRLAAAALIRMQQYPPRPEVLVVNDLDVGRQALSSPRLQWLRRVIAVTRRTSNEPRR